MLVDFYHLVASPLERVFPRICERLIEGGERLLVVAGADQITVLDELLWTHSKDGFLPHGRSNAPRADKQPILLSEHIEPLNGAANVALVDGLWRDEALGFARTFFFFDDTHLDGARASWRALKAVPEATARYWKQDEQGKWVQGP